MIEAVKAFLDNPHTTGALLITGEWGSGKTYFVKNILADDESIADEYVFVFISLFGADGVEDIKKRVKREYFQVKTTWIGRMLNNEDVKNWASSLTGLGSELIEEADEGAFGKTAKTVAKVASIVLPQILKTNWANYAPFKKEMDIKNDCGDVFMRKVILVFDDLERYIDVNPVERTHQVLGIINEYSENQKFKTIVLADEAKIPESSPNSPYRIIKEKAIAQTLRFSSDYSNVFDTIVTRYEKFEEYRNFLFRQKDGIIDAFLDIGNKNIRSIINAFALFRTVFDVLKEKEVDGEDVRGFFFNFLDVFFYSRNGKLDMNLKSKRDNNLSTLLIQALQGGVNDECSNYGRSETTEDERRQKQLANDKYFLCSLFDYIALGQWSSEALSQEINKFLEKKNPKSKLSAKDKILAGRPLLTIEENSILDGFHDAVNEAYNGNLGLDAFINVISADYSLQCWEIERTAIDWNLFTEGIKAAIENIEEESEFDSKQAKRRGFISDDSLQKMSVGARSAYATIDIYKPAVRKNRHGLLEALSSQNIDEVHLISQRKQFEEFDSKIANAFWLCYNKAILPDDKRELFISFKNIASQVTTTYNEGSKNEYICCKNVPDTLASFKWLKTKIESLCSANEKPLTAVISKRFAEAIFKYIKILESIESPSSNEND